MTAMNPKANVAANYIENLVDETAYGEPTALTSDDGKQIDLWFSHGTDNRIAYTCSTDGVTWTAIRKTNLPSGFLRPHVLKHKGIYYLYACPLPDAEIHLFTSTDKLNFDDNGLVLGLGPAGGWDSAHVANMFVWCEGTNWFMLYEASASGPWHIGLATATAPEGPWTRYAGNPVIKGVGSGGVGNPELPRHGSSVLKRDGLYYCYYHGQTEGNSGVQGRACSRDLGTWTIEGDVGGLRFCTRPLWNGTSGWSYGDQALVEFGGRSYLFYSPSNQVDSAHIDVVVFGMSLPQLLAFPPAGPASPDVILPPTMTVRHIERHRSE